MLTPTTRQETNTIVYHAAVTYTDGTSEVFDAIQVTDRGLIISRLPPGDGGELITFGFIPRLSVKHVVTLP